MKSWIIFATSCLLARGAWGAVTWGTHTGVTVLAEDVTAATSAVKVVATTDQGGGSGPITYTIVSVDGDTSSTLFTIGGANNDEVLCKANPGFDYETKKSYVVVVQGDDTAATNTASVTVEISDVDDNDSTWQSLCGSATSDAFSGDVIANIAVCDADVNSAITYHITGGDDNPAFANTGSIVTKSGTPFADSTKTSYALTVEARGVAKTATGTLSVTIGGSCPCLSANSSSSSIRFGLFTLLAAFVLLKI